MPEIKTENTGIFEKLFEGTVYLFFLAIVFVFALNRIHDVDAWLHLSCGRLIWDMKSIPSNEMLVYPTFEHPFNYSAWLFGVLSYGIYLLGNFNGLVLFKGIIITMAFAILLKDMSRPLRNPVISVLVLIGVMILSQYRFVLRPDILLMIYLPLTIYSLRKYILSNSKLIYIIPFLTVLWSNSHASMVLIAVIFMAFIGGGIIQHLFWRDSPDSPQIPTKSQLLRIVVVFILSIAGAFLNPFAINQFITGYYTIEQQNIVITELLPVTGAERTAIIVTAFIVMGSFVLRPWRESVIDFFLATPFLILPFISMRFMFLTGFAAGPVLARNIAAAIEENPRKNIFYGIPSSIAALCLIILYVELAFAGVRPFTVNRALLGFGCDPSRMPVQAVEYMDRNRIYGRIFNDFSFGQYLIWTGYPERTVSIDGRGSVPAEWLLKYPMIYESRETLDELFSRFGFQTILLRIQTRHVVDGQVKDMRVLTISHPDWALVYWDDVAQMFLRREGSYKEIVQRDEYRHINPASSFAHFKASIMDKEDLSKEVGELRRNRDLTGSALSKQFLNIIAEKYFNDGVKAYQEKNYSRASEKYRFSLELNPSSVRAWSNLGYAYYDSDQLDLAQESFTRAVQLDANHGDSCYGLALVFKKQGETDKALAQFERFLNLEPRSRFAAIARKEIGQLSGQER